MVLGNREKISSLGKLFIFKMLQIKKRKNRETIYEDVKKGDIVFVQFVNDEKKEYGVVLEIFTDAQNSNINDAYDLNEKKKWCSVFLFYSNSESIYNQYEIKDVLRR